MLRRWSQSLFPVLQALEFAGSAQCSALTSWGLSLVVLQEPDGETSLQYVKWDDAEFTAGRLVSLADGCVKYREPGWRRCNVKDFSFALESGTMVRLINNTTVAMLKTVASLRPPMRQEVLTFCTLVESCWDSRAAHADPDKRVSNAASLPCCVCKRRLPHGGVIAVRCPLCSLCWHQSCLEGLASGITSLTSDVVQSRLKACLASTPPAELDLRSRALLRSLVQCPFVKELLTDVADVKALCALCSQAFCLAR